MEKIKTSEYYLSVTLLTLGEELLDIEKINGSQRVVFVFCKSPKIDKRIEKFRQKKLKIEPQALFMNHKLLKSRIYSS